MKQLLFLLLFPCLALAQYQGNANQKITLGEQTTADGLVWRGRLADTANLLTNKLDTSVYIVLDTGTRAMWYYRASTTPKWNRVVDSLNNLQGQLSLTTKVTGVLPVANGGTGQTTLAAAQINTGSGTQNYLPKYTAATTFGNSLIYDNGSSVGIGTASPSTKLEIFQAGYTGATNYANKNIKVNSGFGSGYTAGTIVSLLSGYDGSNIYTTDIGHLYDGTGYALTFSTNDNTTGDVIERMRITSAGLVGIGTASPTPGFQLQVTGPNARLAILNSSSASTNNYSQMAFGHGTTDGQYAEFYRQNDNKTFHIYNGGSGKIGLSTRLNNGYVYDIYLNEAGNVGIGTTSPQSGYKLHVVDSVYVGGRVSAAGYTTRSDYNLKDEIQTLNYGINEVIQMQPVKYTYKSNGEQQLGFIAQDIGTLIPESVHFDEFMGVDYQSLIPILTKAIQEQQALIKALEQRIINLENK